MADFDRKLDRPINDLDDIRIIMETQKKIRDSEIDMDMKIDLVEEAFSLLSKYKIQLSKEEVEKVESLEYNWLQLQGKAMDVQILLLTVQEHFQKELISNLEVFQVSCNYDTLWPWLKLSVGFPRGILSNQLTVRVTKYTLQFFFHQKILT